MCINSIVRYQKAYVYLTVYDIKVGFTRKICRSCTSMQKYQNCKILLPKFNTWKQGQIEREKGFEVPLRSIVDWFFAKNHCRYGAIASPLHRNRNAIVP